MAASLERSGIIRDKQMVNTPPHQRLVWVPDSAENLIYQSITFLRGVTKGAQHEATQEKGKEVQIEDEVEVKGEEKEKAQL